LAQRRAAIRMALRAAGETWIDDPVNDDSRSPRARARAGIGPEDSAPPSVRDDAVLAELARAAELHAAGFIRLDRERLRLAPASAARRLLAAAVLCVGGGAQPPRGARLERLHRRAVGPAPFQATLAGSKIIGAADILIVRDAGEARRGGLAPIEPEAGVPAVWDGRFEVTLARSGMVVRPLAGAATQLDKAQRRALQALPAPARPGLPVLVRGDAAPVCPILASTGEVSIVSLVPARFLAGCGAILKEPAT
jgi:tRNA(Ile)-lysidine synthase